MSDPQQTSGGDTILPNGLRVYKGRMTQVSDAGTNPCAGLPNGSTHCFDGVLFVNEPPSFGDGWVEVYIPGVGWSWYNLNDLANLTQAATTKPAPTKKPKPKPKKR